MICVIWGSPLHWLTTFCNSESSTLTFTCCCKLKQGYLAPFAQNNLANFCSVDYDNQLSLAVQVCVGKYAADDEDVQPRRHSTRERQSCSHRSGFFGCLKFVNCLAFLGAHILVWAGCLPCLPRSNRRAGTAQLQQRQTKLTGTYWSLDDDLGDACQPSFSAELLSKE